MGDGFKIICPSYRRAGNVYAYGLFRDKLIIAVIESELESYKKYYPDANYMVMPNHIKGNMSVVRNYIRDNAGCRYIVMVDDDLKELGYHEKGQMVPMRNLEFRLDRILDFIENGFIMAEEIGTVLWGLNVNKDPRSYRECSLFSLTQVVLGPFSGQIIKDDGIRYDERFPFKEDYDFALQVLYKYRKILRFDKYYYVVNHLVQAGGCGDFRVLEHEKEQLELLQKKWGKEVVRYDIKKSVNPRIVPPLKGV